MADSAVAVTAGSGTNIDTRTEATNGNHRQVIVIGDPSTNAAVAPVDATSGLSVTLTTALPAGSAAIGKLAANSGVDIGDVDVASVPADPFGVNADAASATGSISAKLRFIAATGIPITGTVTVGSHAVTNVGTFVVQPQPSTSGGLSVFRSLDLDESEEEVKSSAGCLYKLRLTNRAATARYVKLYDANLAGTTVGTTTPIDTIIVPGATSADLATVLTENFGGIGLTFATALCLAATTGLADADTGAPSANDVVATAYYK